MSIRVGIDTGGTFTDLVAVDEHRRRWYFAKVPSSRTRPVEALKAAVNRAGFDPAEVSFLVVGTTIGINAVLTRTGARILYLTTRGFEDIPHIQRINRKNHYDFVWRKPAPLVDRRDCIGVCERVDAEGKVITSLDPEELERLVSEHPRSDDEWAVAVCFLFSYLNPSAELAAREAIAQAEPDLPVSLSHEVAPIWREYERGTAAIIDAYLKPDFARYVSGVSEAFAEEGIRATWSLLKSNGGHVVSHEAQARPSHVLLSGIAGAAIGGAHVARQADAAKVIALDMGGTSCDVCLVDDGAPTFSSEFEIEFGLPVVVPTVSTKTIGAGGGSIGWIDPGGFLQVGPQSAGADPGSACYGRNGADATLGRSVNLKSTTASGREVGERFAEVESTAVANFNAQGGSGGLPNIQRSIAMRYEGQNYEQEIPVPEGEITDDALAQILERYHVLHDEFYGYRFEGVPIEMVRILVSVRGDEPRLLALSPQPAGAESQAREERIAEVHFPETGFLSTPVAARGQLEPDASRPGPLVLESMDTTIVVPPGWTAHSSANGILDLRRAQQGPLRAAAGEAADQGERSAAI